MNNAVLCQWWKRLSLNISQDKTFTDVVIVSSDGEKIHCHQLILALASPMLSALLQHSESETVCICLPDIESRVIKNMMKLIYGKYHAGSAEEQREIDSAALSLGLRLKLNQSNVIFKCDDWESSLKNDNESFMEEETTFLFVDEVQSDNNLTLDETEMNQQEPYLGELIHETKAQTLSSSHTQLHSNADDGDLLKDEQIMIVPIESHEEVINETVEIDQTDQLGPSSPKLIDEQSCVHCSSLITNHKNYRDYFQCCKCTESCDSHSQFLKHMSDHNYICPICMKDKLRHKVDKNIYCCQCKKKVLSCKFSFHVMRHIESDSEFSKDENKCAAESNLYEESKSSKDLNAISRAVMPRIVCPSCSKSMTRRHYIKHHKASCSGEIILKCSTCSKEGFCNNATLQDHIRAKHTQDRPFKCNYCNRAFPAASHLAHHRMKKHRVNSRGEIQPKVLFPCSFCGKVLTTKPKLLAHVKVIHHGIKEFNCKSCSKTFSSKSNLDIHVGSVHTGNLPYKCELCSKSFARKNLLSAHRQTNHQFIEAHVVHVSSHEKT